MRNGLVDAADIGLGLAKEASYGWLPAKHGGGRSLGMASESSAARSRVADSPSSLMHAHFGFN